MIRRFIHSIATGPLKRRRLLTPLGFSLFALSIVFVITGGIFTDRLLAVRPLPQEPVWIATGMVLLVMGAVFCGMCVAMFAKARGTPVPLNPPHELLVEGPYRYSRNPMLTGVFLMLFGAGVLLRSTSLVLVWVPAYIVLHALELLFVEEPELEQRFGETYIGYKRRVPMFFPRPWRHRTS